MKPIASLLLALALHAAALTQATANDGTFKPQQAPGEPIKPRQTTTPDHSVPAYVKMKTDEMLPFDASQIGQLDVRDPRASGFVPSIVEYGVIDTRHPHRQPSVAEADNPLVSSEMLPFDASTTSSVAEAHEWLAQLLKDNTEGDAIRLSDLFLNPEFFAAAHAVGPQADALRGQLDWLMLSGVILGFDGMDGSDDLCDGYIEQDNVLRDGYIEQDNVLHGGFRADPTLPSQEPAKNGYIFGTRTYLAGDSQDHNPDIAND